VLFDYTFLPFVSEEQVSSDGIVEMIF